MRSTSLRRSILACVLFAVPLVANAGGGFGPPPSTKPFDWTGFYFGGTLGGAWSDVDWHQNYNYFTSNGATLVGTDSSFSPSGVTGGAIAGANIQSGSWVFGAEASFSGADLSSTAASPFFPASDVFSTQIDWLTTVEGRIGFAHDQLLLFAKGGWAGGKVDYKLEDAGAGIVATGDTFADGWTIGGGLEYALSRSLVLGVEYNYTRLSFDASTDCPNCGVGVGFGTPYLDGTVDISSVKARASYLFHTDD